MSEVLSKKISAIIKYEAELEQLIHHLTIETVDRHAISIQGSPAEINLRYGKPEVEPDIIQHSKNPPKREYFLEDDFGWVLGFTFALPVFISMVIGIFVIGDIRSIYDNIVFGSLGAIIGSLIGTLLTVLLRKHQMKKIKAQEKVGGFVIWITVISAHQEEAVIHILKEHHASEITSTET